MRLVVDILDLRIWQAKHTCGGRLYFMYYKHHTLARWGKCHYPPAGPDTNA